MSLILYRDMKDKCQRLEPGCSALYTWQNPIGERLLVWRCADKNKNFEDKLIQVPRINLLNSCKRLELFATRVIFSRHLSIS